MPSPTSLLPLAETPPAERPRERLRQAGAGSLSLRECLALILGTGPRGVGHLGVAHRIVETPGSGLGAREAEGAFFTALESTGRGHLATVRGLGDTGEARLLAAFELARRYAAFREGRRVHSRGLSQQKRRRDLPEQACDRIDAGLRDELREWLGFVPVYRTGEVGGFCLVESGVRTHVNLDPVELFARLLAVRPLGFYLFHNHPSGDLTPSPSDEELTRNVQQLASRFGIRLLGHGIVSARDERWIVL